MNSLELKLTSALWKKALEQGHVYIVILRGAIPFIEDPDIIPQEPYLTGKQAESLIIAFVNEEGAQTYRSALTEIHDDLRPSELTIGKFTLESLFSMIDELTEVSKKEFGHPIRIDLAQQLDNETVLADVLYSKYKTKH